MAKRIITFKDYMKEEMYITSLTAGSVIISQPVRNWYDIWLVVRSGHVRILSDILSSDIGPGTFSVYGAERTLEVIDVSEDFCADVVILHESFRDDLGIGELLPLKIRFNTLPTIRLDKDISEAVDDFLRMAKRIIALEDNPFRKESLLCLTRSFYYGAGYYIFREADRIGTDDSIPTRFMNLVEQHSMKEREVGFYADKLCLTPKYLSRLIKKKLGSTAKDIISRYVLLHARGKLLNTDLTILQISDALGFPSQSVFGKFFKNMTGQSPSEYRLRPGGNPSNTLTT